MRERFPETLPHPWETIKEVVLFLALICLLGAASWLLAAEARRIWISRAGQAAQTAPLPAPAQAIVDARDAGQYDKALQLAADGLAAHPEIPQIRELSDLLHQDFNPAFETHCQRHGRALEAGTGANDCQVLAPEDEFWVEVHLPAAARRYYAYLFLVDSKDDWKVLLPNSTNANPLWPATYTAPDNYGRLHPPETPGPEKLYLVVAWWRIPALEDLSAKLAAETDPERARELGRQLDARIRLERAKPAALKGLKAGWLDFKDSGTQ
jgi:hypothetical protein